MCLTKLPVIDFSIGSTCAGDEIISFDRGDTSTKDTSIGFVPSKPAQLVLVYGLTNWPFTLIRRTVLVLYLLYTKLSFGNEGLPVSTMVRKWCDTSIIRCYPGPGEHAMLFFDSYDMDNTWCLSLTGYGKTPSRVV
jgi:hypothetical protein